MKRFLKYFAPAVLCLGSVATNAQQVSVKAAVDSVDLVMGDRAHITVSVDVPVQMESSVQLVDFPVLTPGAEYIPFHGVDVVASDSTTTRSEGKVRYDFDFTIRAFDPGTNKHTTVRRSSRSGSRYCKIFHIGSQSSARRRGFPRDHPSYGEHRKSGYKMV